MASFCADPPVLVVGVGSADADRVAHACRVKKCAEYMFARCAGSVAEPGDRNPYAGRSLILAKLWMSGYMRMLAIRINSGPEMKPYLEARRGV